MARWIVLAIVAFGRFPQEPPETAIMLREQASGTARVLIEMRGEGEYRPEAPAGSLKGTVAPKPQPLKIESRLDFVERVASSDEQGRPRRTARRVVEAATAVDGRLLKIRPVVASLVADRRDEGVVVTSSGGPLTRWELEMVQVPGDPLALVGLLPEKPVKVGDRWVISDAAARNLSDYDTIDANGLEAKLDSLDPDRAECRVGGTIRGSTRGGEGVIAFTGQFTFDRKSKRISKMKLSRDETRTQGIVEWGLAVKSTITVERVACETPGSLSDDAMAALPREGDSSLERLLLESPDRKYSLEHDRDWHLTLETPRQVVLKRLEKGDLLAQCNIAVGPFAGKGRHQDPDGFREDVKKALGPRFGQIVGEGEVPGPSEDDYRYKVGAAGREGSLDVLWYYYLIASPAGDQLLATFTLDAASSDRFGNRDEVLIGALAWRPAER